MEAEGRIIMGNVQGQDGPRGPARPGRWGRRSVGMRARARKGPAAAATCAAAPGQGPLECGPRLSGATWDGGAADAEREAAGCRDADGLCAGPSAAM